MRWSILVLSAVLLAACGQAGSLYLPDGQAERTPAGPRPDDAAPPKVDEAEARKRQTETLPETPAQ